MSWYERKRLVRVDWERDCSIYVEAVDGRSRLEVWKYTNFAFFTQVVELIMSLLHLQCLCHPSGKKHMMNFERGK